MTEPVEDPETDSVCDNFLKSLRYRGLCEIALKRDARDGRVRLIEVNPRYTGTSDVAPYAGVDLGWLHYLDLVGHKVQSVDPDGIKFRHVCLIWDVSSMGGYISEGSWTLKEIIRSYRRPIAFYDVDFRNWRVTLRTIIDVLKIVFGRPVRRFLARIRSS